MVLKKILCPIDFSPYSVEALSAASELAVHFSADLRVLHAIPEIPVAAVPGSQTTFNVAEYQQQLVEGFRRKLDELVASVLPPELRPPSSRTITVVVHGEPSYQIVRYARAEKIDLIVLATRGRTGWEHVVFGSVAERVVRLSPCPVLTLRGEEALQTNDPADDR